MLGVPTNLVEIFGMYAPTDRFLYLRMPAMR